MLHNAGFEIVTDCPHRNAAKCLVHVNMAPEPCIHLHIQRGLHVGIPAVCEAGNKEMHGNGRAGITVDDLHGRPAPIDLALGSGLMLQMIGQVMGCAVPAVILTELGMPYSNVSILVTPVTILRPEQ